jgi:hypothetical protein
MYTVWILQYKCFAFNQDMLPKNIYLKQVTSVCDLKCIKQFQSRSVCTVVGSAGGKKESMSLSFLSLGSLAASSWNFESKRSGFLAHN